MARLIQERAGNAASILLKSNLSEKDLEQFLKNTGHTQIFSMVGDRVEMCNYIALMMEQV